jgi:hypothetical protein
MRAGQSVRGRRKRKRPPSNSPPEAILPHSGLHSVSSLCFDRSWIDSLCELPCFSRSYGWRASDSLQIHFVSVSCPIRAVSLASLWRVRGAARTGVCKDLAAEKMLNCKRIQVVKGVQGSCTKKAALQRQRAVDGEGEVVRRRPPFSSPFWLLRSPFSLSTLYRSPECGGVFWLIARSFARPYGECGRFIYSSEFTSDWHAVVCVEDALAIVRALRSGLRNVVNTSG